MNRVGAPVAEKALTVALSEQARCLFPGDGRPLMVLDEPELAVSGSRRPDAVLLLFDASGVETIRRRAELGLRLRLPVHAAALAEIAEPDPVRRGHLIRRWSGAYARKAARDVTGAGWSADDQPPGRVFADALVVEAKMSDWRRGLAQLSASRWAGRKSALLMPAAVVHRVRPEALTHEGIGLLAHDGGGAIGWRREPADRPLGLMADLWLAELAIRRLETGAPPDKR